MAWTNSAVASATFTITAATKIVGSGGGGIGGGIGVSAVAGSGGGAGTSSGGGLSGVDGNYEIFGRGLAIKHPSAGEPFKVKIKAT